MARFSLLVLPVLLEMLVGCAQPAAPAAKPSAPSSAAAPTAAPTAPQASAPTSTAAPTARVKVRMGKLPTVSARFEDQPELQKVLSWADDIRRMGVWTNADKPEEAAQARSYGAEGIGLCRTEHMFREGERLEIVRGAILVANQATRAKARLAAGETLDHEDRVAVGRFDAAMAELEVLQQGDFEGIFKAMDGLPVVVRLIDPPLHEFLPNLEEQLVKVTRAGDAATTEDRELLAMPVEGVDVLVSNRAIDGKPLVALAQMPETRGVFLRKIVRGATATVIPILPNTTLQRGDVITIAGRTQDTNKAVKLLGVADRPTDATDMAFVGLFITIGALIGSLVFRVAGVPLTLSTAGGALVAGIVGGWLRSVHPSFGRVPTPTIWFMNSVGLNIFIAIVGISAGPGFVNGLKTQGIGLFLWGVVATTVPLVLGMFTAKYLFRFHDALTLGIVSGARTTTASLGLVCDIGKSQVPALGYTVTYAVGNTLLTIWGMVVIMLLS